MTETTQFRNFPPPSPGRVLREKVLKHMDVTQEQLAHALGVSRFTVNQILRERRSVTPDMALRLGHVLNTSPEMWLRLQSQLDLFEARLRLQDQIAQLPTLK